MKKLLTALLTFFSTPLTYIGGYHIVKVSHVPDGVAGFLAVLGAAIIIFQVVLAAMLFVAAYREIWKDQVFGYEEKKGR